MSSFWQDLRYAFRSLTKSPGIASVALLSLALGIGANTALFSLFNALTLRRLPISQPEQLVGLTTSVPDNPRGEEAFTEPMFDVMEHQRQIFSGVFAWAGGVIANFEANRQHFAAGLDHVSGDYFQVLGVAPYRGRFFSRAEVAQKTGTSRAVAVISYRCWKQRYGGDPNALGQTIRIEGHPFTVIGVLPPSFSSLIIDGASDVTIPLFSPGQANHETPTRVWLDIYGRLKPGVTLSRARAAMETLWPRIQAATLPPDYAGVRRERYFARKIQMQSAGTGISYLRPRFSRPLIVLLLVAGAVLALACLNLAHLMLARTAARRQEMGVRVALGAGTWQLLRQVLAEAMLLSTSGTVLGLLLAFGLSRVLLRMMWTGYVATPFRPALDWRVGAFTTALTVVTSFLFGLAPAFEVMRTDPKRVLEQASRTVRSHANGCGKVLVATQIGLSLAVLIGALLLGRSLSNFYGGEAGYRRSHLLLMQLFPQPGHVAVTDRAYYRELAEKMARLPGVNSVSYSNVGPANQFEDTKPVNTRQRPELLQAVIDVVGPNFFRTMGMQVLAGREFTWQDDEHAPAIAVISESLGESLFPHDNPLGQQVLFGPPGHQEAIQIVGVVNSASLWKREHLRPPAIYRPLLQAMDIQQPTLDIRTMVDPHALQGPAERLLQSLGRDYSLRTQTVEERLGSFLTAQRLAAVLSGFFSALALLLAAVGLYGLLSYTITRRTAEIGIRMALGAQRTDVLRLIGGEIASLTVLGMALGLATAYALSRSISGLLFGIAPTDLFTLLTASVILILTAVAAIFWPARHACSIDPAAALRTE